MKFAFLTPEFPGFSHSGGIGTSIYNLSKGLIKKGNIVNIILYGQDKDEFLTFNNLNIYKVKNIKIKGFSLYFSVKKIQNLINILYKQDKIDFIEVPDWTGISAFLNVSCPVIMRLNGSDSYFCFLESRSVKYKNKFLEKRAFSKANKIISVSHFTGKLTNSVFNLRRNFEVIPNSVDSDFFSPCVSKDFHEPYILYFGTLIRKKGVLEIPYIFNEIYKEHKNIKLILIGKDAFDICSGNYSTWSLMKRCFSDNALKNVIYKGVVNYGEVKNYILNSLVCFFPSYAEALPVSWLEVMSMQKVIVASDIGWAKEIINNKVDGFLVNPKDHIGFANTIISLLSDSSLRSKISISAREKILNKFSHDVVASQNINFYSNLLSL